jgi:hypothetical protein
MPLFNPTRQPAAPGIPDSRLNTEPIYMTISASQPRGNDEGTEYLVTWFAGQIPEDVVSSSYHITLWLINHKWLADRPM